MAQLGSERSETDRHGLAGAARQGKALSGDAVRVRDGIGQAG